MKTAFITKPSHNGIVSKRTFQGEDNLSSKYTTSEFSSLLHIFSSKGFSVDKNLRF